MGGSGFRGSPRKFGVFTDVSRSGGTRAEASWVIIAMVFLILFLIKDGEKPDRTVRTVKWKGRSGFGSDGGEGEFDGTGGSESNPWGLI